MSDAVFDTRLDARTLIEASAGTGKTYALAGLFVRAVIVGRLRVPQILAVTYTDAATQELRARVRLRLQQACALAARWCAGDREAVDDDDAETALLRRLIHLALNDAAGESLPMLRMRLERAQRDIDLAAISTIHGFCQRLLAEHALDTAQPLLAAEIEPRNAAARTRLAVDLWREFARDAEGAAFLRRAFGDIDALAASLQDLLAPEPLLPPPSALPPDPRPAIATAWRAVRACFDRSGDAVLRALSAAIAGKVLNNVQYKPAHVDALWAWCAAHSADAPPMRPHDKLVKYTPSILLAGTSKAGIGRTPQAPLFEAFAVFLDAHASLDPWQAACDLQRLHALRAVAREREAARKQTFNVRDYDDLIGAVFAAIGDTRTAPGLVAALRQQYPLALVDEFQDTDARQWTIFRALFGDGGLVLVGDPKQAIYRFRGGDVHTYLRAAQASIAGPPLLRNFRARPCLLDAVEALFAQAPADALGAQIAFQHLDAGGNAHDDDFMRDGASAPALVAHLVPPRTVETQGASQYANWSKDESIEIAAALCADAIRDRLQLAREGRLLLRDGERMRALAPRDCAVLVRTHREASAVRHALARRGVQAVAGGKLSLFETDEAQELLTLLLALRSAGDDRRLRGALATRMLGLDAAAIAALENDGDALRHWQQSFEAWRARWERHGPQALVADIVAEQATRLLRDFDGERRVTNLLQLAESMQVASARSLGTQGQLDWLRAAIANADANDEAQQPRLESDAGRVQILTLHKSKGLEFPQVFLPFAGIGRKHPAPKTVAMYPLAGQRVRQWKLSVALSGAPSWADASERHLEEERAEDMRLLYVGLTRAQHALWLCCGALASHANTALARLLGGSAPSPSLREGLGANAIIVEGLPSAAIKRLPPLPASNVPPARVPVRRLPRDWWIHSFSQLHQQKSQGAQALADEAPADDERTPSIDAHPRDARFSGARFGNVLHVALEHADFSAWRDCDAQTVPDTQREGLVAALRSQGYREADDTAALRELVPLVARTLNASLPEGIRLCDLPPSARIAELEFHFGLRDAKTRELLALLQTYGLLRERRDFGAWQQLSGLMTGKLDLVYRYADRVYVLDYKSNDLSGYDQPALAERMAASEYDLQALLYAVALHRWLRVRLGEAYDFDRHFGGARYLFSRGLDPRDPSLGVFVPALSRALIEATDALLAAPIRGAA